MSIAAPGPSPGIPQAAPPVRRGRLRIALTAAAAALATLALVAFYTWSDLRESNQRSEVQARELASVVELETSRALEETVAELRSTLTIAPTGDDATLARLYAGKLAAHPMLAAIVVPLSEGRVATAGDLADTAPLLAWLASVREGTEALVLGPPVQGRAGQAKLLPILIRMPGAEGGPSLAVGALRTDFLARMMETLRLPDDTLLGVLDRGGTLIARAPYLEAAVGRNHAQTPIYLSAPRGVPVGTVVGTTPADAVERHMAFKRSPRFPVDAIAGFSRERMLAPWQARAWRNASLALAILLVIGALATQSWRRAAGEIEAQRATALSEAHHRTALEVLAEGVVTHDATGTIVTWNASALRILGLTADQLRGRSSMDPSWRAMRADGSDFPGDEHPAMVALKTGQPQLDVLMAVELGDGSRRWLLVSAVPTHSGDAIDGAVTSFVDVTETRAVTEKMLTLNSALEERVAARTAAFKRTSDELEDLVYSMAHTMRAPLRHIASFATLLAEDGAKRLSTDDLDLVRRIRQSAERQARLVDDLLRYTAGHQHQPAFAHVSMDAMTDAVIRDTLERMPDARRVEWVRSPLPRLFGDPAMLSEILEILLSNAAKFSSRREAPVVEIRACALDGMAGIEVRDNGVGFDMRYVDKLFGMFQRLHEGEGFMGSGIDLAICRRLVERQGGVIEAEGRVGEGAAFRFALPASRNRAPEEGGEARAA